MQQHSVNVKPDGDAYIVECDDAAAGWVRLTKAKTLPRWHAITVRGRVGRFVDRADAVAFVVDNVRAAA